MKKTLLILLCAILGRTTYSQHLADTTQNLIENPQALSTFFAKLQNCKMGKERVEILHIGDSHIQGGFFTGKLREQFQQNFGAAGRGLVFPYRLAKTNGNMDVRFSSNVQWQRYRIITENAPKTGMAGATVYTDAPSFYVRMHSDSAFSQVEIVGKGLKKLKIGIPKGKLKTVTPVAIQKIYEVKSGDVLGKISLKYKVTVGQLKAWNHLRSDRIRIGQKLKINVVNTSAPWQYHQEDFTWLSPYEHSDTTMRAVLQNPATELYLVKDEEDVPQQTSIYGLFLRMNRAGIVYHAIGFNGAKYMDYDSSPLFFNQLRYFSPDLVILSLGTNEAFDKVYKLEVFRADVEQFCKKLEQQTACKNILLTTPPSALRQRKYPNKKLIKYVTVLKEIAAERNYAVWDLYEIMGGAKGMALWYKKNYARPDRIHFTEDGYALQAELLYNALIRNTEYE